MVYLCFSRCLINKAFCAGESLTSPEARLWSSSSPAPARGGLGAAETRLRYLKIKNQLFFFQSP